MGSELFIPPTGHVEGEELILHLPSLVVIINFHLPFLPEPFNSVVPKQAVNYLSGVI